MELRWVGSLVDLAQLLGSDADQRALRVLARVADLARLRLELALERLFCDTRALTVTLRTRGFIG